MNDSGVSRRTLLGMLLLGPLGLLAPGLARGAAGGGWEAASAAQAIIGVVGGWRQDWRPVTEDWREGVRVACNMMEPSTHVEIAYLISCCLSREVINREMIEEFVTRRSGAPARHLPDHPLLALKRYVLPDTHRIMAFDEQGDRLLSMLTGRDAGDPELFKAVDACKSQQDYRAILRPKYRERLSLDEIDALLGAFVLGADSAGESYVTCSTLALQVESVLARDRAEGRGPS